MNAYEVYDIPHFNSDSVDAEPNTPERRRFVEGAWLSASPDETCPVYDTDGKRSGRLHSDRPLPPGKATESLQRAARPSQVYCPTTNHENENANDH